MQPGSSPYAQSQDDWHIGQIVVVLALLIFLVCCVVGTLVFVGFVSKRVFEVSPQDTYAAMISSDYNKNSFSIPMEKHNSEGSMFLTPGLN